MSTSHSALERWLPWAFLILGILIVLRAAQEPRYSEDYAINDFATLPVQHGGRIKPIDSVAMNTLLQIHGKRSIKLEDGTRMNAIQWFMEVTMQPQRADKLRVFRIDHDEVLGLIGEQQGRKYFAFEELRPHFQQIFQESQRARDKEAQLRTAYEKQLVKLAQALTSYFNIQHTLQPPEIPAERLRDEYLHWSKVAHEATTAVQKNELVPEATQTMFIAYVQNFQELAKNSNVGLIPPSRFDPEDAIHWGNSGEALLSAAATGELPHIMLHYADIATAYSTEDAASFNKSVETLQAIYNERHDTGTVAFEEFFNTSSPFIQSMVLYVISFLLAIASWIILPEPLRKSALWLLVLAFVVHSFGLFARMYIQGRPPVTNLYSSAIFVGWGAPIVAFMLERILRNGIGTAVGAIIGFATLVIAHNLGLSGDTLEMMQAVLDSNFWLATHVVIITLGYSAMFLAGVLGIAYVIAHTMTGALDKKGAKALERTIYGVVCFAALFSFVGTMLGGVWADQSWGRFWGWDPKENGALLIVLWTAVILHARWGGFAKGRGVAMLAIGGNIITSWSWFGTNLLGVGLHAYGFTDRGTIALGLFVLSQLFIIAIGYFPWSKLKTAS